MEPPNPQLEFRTHFTTKLKKESKEILQRYNYNNLGYFQDVSCYIDNPKRSILRKNNCQIRIANGLWNQSLRNSLIANWVGKLFVMCSDCAAMQFVRKERYRGRRVLSRGKEQRRIKGGLPSQKNGRKFQWNNHCSNGTIIVYICCFACCFIANYSIARLSLRWCDFC